MADRVPPADMARQLMRAADAFALNGVDETRIDDLASATGIPRATLYYYFSGKDEIFAYVLHGFVDEVAAAVNEAMASGGTVEERLRRVVRAQLNLLVEHPGTARMLMGNQGKARAMPALGEAMRASFHVPVIALLEEGMAEGTILKADPEELASVIYGAVTVPFFHFSSLNVEVPVDSLLALIPDVVCHGICITRRRR